MLKTLLSGCSIIILAVFSNAAFAAEPLQPRAQLSLKGGNDRNVMTTEFWAPIAQQNDQVFYADIRLMGDNNENREGNFGLGYRKISPYTDTVLGGHVWIDRRRTQNNANFHQVTIGAESLGDKIDLRANGYIPLNGAKNLGGTGGGSGSSTPYLAGSGIFYDINGAKIETPQFGADAEIGYRLPILENHIDAFRVYGGGYHFFRNETEHVTGLRFRADAQVNKVVSVGARFQHDGTRGSQGFLEATIRFPFSAKKLYQTDNLHSRLDESPERDVDIVTATKSSPSQTMIPVLNNVTGVQQRVLYVDNTHGGGGDGTKENPFNTLAAAQAALQDNDVLYVNRGNGTTSGMDQGITISRENVLMIGSGSNFIWDNSRFTTASGSSFSGTLLQAGGAAPVLTNSQTWSSFETGNAVYINGNNVTVSGITVSGAANNGIFIGAASGASLTTAIITNVTAENNTNSGILAYTDGGQINTVNINQSTSRNNDSYGIASLADNSGQISNLNITGNTVDNNNDAGIYVTSTNQSMIDQIMISDNTSTNNKFSQGSGIYLSSSGTGSQLGDALIRNNTTNNNDNDGITVYIENNSTVNGTITFSGNSATGNTASGINLNVFVGFINDAVFTNNTANSNIDSGLKATVFRGDANAISFTQNTTNGNSANGITAATEYIGTLQTLLIDNNTSLNNTGAGIGLLSRNTGNLINTATITNNTASGNGFSGMHTETLYDGLINAMTISHNDFHNNQNGISFTTTSVGTMNQLTVDHNLLQNNISTGFSITTGNDSVFNAVNVSYNTITGNGSVGIALQSVDVNARIDNVSISYNDIIGNGGTGSNAGIHLRNTDPSAILTVDLGGGSTGSAGQNNISGNINNDIYAQFVNGGNVSAQNNYWGGGALTNTDLQGTPLPTIDASSYLTVAPIR